MCWLIGAMQIPKYLVENVVVFPFLARSFAQRQELFEPGAVSDMAISWYFALPASGRGLISVELQLSLCALIHPAIYFCINYIFHSQGNINSNHLPPSLAQISRRGTLNMAPRRRVTERRDQLVASVDRGRPHPFSVPGWVGGIWRPRQGPLWCDTHTNTHTHTEGLEPPRLGPRSPWETRCHQASDRGGVLCTLVCMRSHLGSTHTPPPENAGHWLLPHPHGDSAVVSAHQN